MSHQRRIITRLLWLLAFSLFARPIAHADPVNVQQLEYNLETTFEAYKKVGNQNVVWDEAVKKALTGYAQYRSITNGKIAKIRSEVEVHLNRAIASKCNDPLVCYLHLRLCQNLSDSNLTAAMTNAAALLQSSEYPPIRKAYATIWSWKSLPYVQQATSDGRSYLLKGAGYGK